MSLIDDICEIEIIVEAGPRTKINIPPALAYILINKVLDAAWSDIKIMQQALLEINHAQREGPDWYTKGDSGLYQQVRMWLDKGLKASESLNKLRGE